MCLEWKRAGYDPIVAVLNSEPRELEPEFRRAGIQLEWLAMPVGGYSRYLRLVAESRSLVRRERPLGILSMPLGWHACIALGAKLAGSSAQVLGHVGNYPPHWTGKRFGRFKALVKTGSWLGAQLVCCSEYVRQGVLTHFSVPKKQTVVVYNGADCSGTSVRARAVRQARARSGQRIRLGMVARYEQHKDQPTLIRAVRILLDEGFNCELELVGEGSRRAEFEQLIRAENLSDRVFLLGLRRDVPELLGSWDLFCFAAKPDEGLGVALIEAMAAEVPIVATDVGACREVTQQGRLATLVEPGSAAALAEGIKKTLANPELMTTRTRSSRRHAEQVFSVSSMSATYLGLLVGTAGN